MESASQSKAAVECGKKNKVPQEGRIKEVVKEKRGGEGSSASGVVPKPLWGIKVKVIKRFSSVWKILTYD